MLKPILISGRAGIEPLSYFMYIYRLFYNLYKLIALLTYRHLSHRIAKNVSRRTNERSAPYIEFRPQVPATGRLSTALGTHAPFPAHFGRCPAHNQRLVRLPTTDRLLRPLSHRRYACVQFDVQFYGRRIRR